MYRVNNKLKLTLIVCFIFITISSLVTFFTPLKGYEISIYESTPYIVWILLLFSILGGVSVIVHQVFTKQYKCSNFWLLGFFLLILCRVILLYIPFIKGYYTWNGDNISHIGALKDIVLTHNIPLTNFYPATHLLLAEVLLVSNLPIGFIVNYSTAIFSVFYIISIYLLSTVILSTKESQILSIAASCGVLFNQYNVYLMPNGWSIHYMIFLFFCYFKSLISASTSKYRFLFVITLILYPFFHPLSSTLIVFMFIAIAITKWSTYFQKKHKVVLKDFLALSQINIIVLESIMFIFWIFSFSLFERNIHGLYNAVTTGKSLNVIAEMESTLNRINFNYIDFIIITIKIMGDEIIFIFLTVIAFVILLTKYDQKERNNNLLIVIILTFFFAFFYIIYLFSIIPGFEILGGERLVGYLPIFTPIPAGFALSYLVNKKIKFSPIICVCIIMIGSMISIFSLFNSPYITQPSIEVTQMDMSGSKWFFDSKNESLGDIFILSPTFRFRAGLFGSANCVTVNESLIPDHFNYTNHKYLANSYLEDKYAVITMFDRTIYESVWKAVGRFNNEDFTKLENDFTVNKLYSNGETYVYYITDYNSIMSD
jgi:hypothetical protein